MKIKVYGSHLCPDTRAALAMFEEKGIAVDFKNFSEDLSVLKEFLKIRDTSPLFENTRKNGGIGIPLMVLADGTMTMDTADIK